MPTEWIVPAAPRAIVPRANVELLEKVARVYYYALTTGQEISLLDSESVETIFALLKSEQRKEKRRKRKLARG